MKEDKHFNAKVTIYVIIIIAMLIYPLMLAYDIFRFYNGVQKTPEIAETYAEEKYNMDMNVVTNSYKYFLEPYCNVVLSPVGMEDLTFVVQMNTYNLNEVYNDEYYDS